MPWVTAPPLRRWRIAGAPQQALKRRSQFQASPLRGLGPRDDRRSYETRASAPNRGKGVHLRPAPGARNHPALTARPKRHRLPRAGASRLLASASGVSLDQRLMEPATRHGVHHPRIIGRKRHPRRSDLAGHREGDLTTPVESIGNPRLAPNRARRELVSTKKSRRGHSGRTFWD